MVRARIPRILLVLLGLSLSCRPSSARIAHASADAARAPCYPVITERAWEPYDSVALTARSYRLDPKPLAALPPDSSVHYLAGEYQWTVIATRGALRDSSATARLSLQRTTIGAPAFPEWPKHVPLWGWSDMRLDEIAPMTVAHALSERNPWRPGVQVIFEPQRRALIMRAGNAFVIDSSGMFTRTTDVGVLFYVFEVTDQGLRGWWRSSAHLQGYFCAWRLDA